MISLRNLTEFNGVIARIVQDFGMRPRSRHIRKLPEKELDEIESKLEEIKIKETEEELNLLANKSGLQPHHYNIQHGKVPYSEPVNKYQHTVEYKRKMYGQYGSASGVDPSILWPDKKELELAKEYEAVAHPRTLPELIDYVKNEEKKAEETKRQREQEISQKLKTRKDKIISFNMTVRKKFLSALEVKETKEQVAKQIRQQFGFDIDRKHERFRQEMEKIMEERKEQLKAQKKEARKEQKRVQFEQKFGISQGSESKSSTAEE